jgi:hypothetical protein
MAENEQNIITEYFTSDNLKTFLRNIRDRYMTKKDTLMGLKLEQGKLAGKTLVLDTIDPGHYYYSKTPVESINLGLMVSSNSNVMGEAMIQFKTSEKYNHNLSEIIGNKWCWIMDDGNSSPVFYPNSEYLIHITSDNQDEATVFARVTKYEETSINVTNKNQIEITYKFVSDKANKFSPVNGSWVHQMEQYIDHVLYSADGKNGSKSLQVSDLYGEIKCEAVDGICTPKIVIVLKNDLTELTLENIMYDKSFNTFKLNVDEKVMITSAKQAFRNCSNVLSIDLTKTNDNIDTHPNWEECKSYESMFYGCGKSTGATGTLKINGIDTSKATSLANMFNGCKLINSSNSKQITQQIKTNNCSNFDHMFYNTSLSDIDISGWEIGDLALTNSTINCSNMFGDTSINDDDLSQISGFIDKMYSKLHDRTGLVLNYSYMFANCKKITNLSQFPGLNIGNYKFDISKLQADRMFSGCLHITSFPVLNITTENSYINIKGIFTSACSAANSVDFGNLKEWSVPMRDDTVLLTDDMFINCGFEKGIGNDIVIFKESSDKGLSSGNFSVSNALYRTGGISKTVNITLNVYLNQSWGSSDVNNYKNIIKNDNNMQLYVPDRLHYILTTNMKSYYSNYNNINKK